MLASKVKDKYPMREEFYLHSLLSEIPRTNGHIVKDEWLRGGRHIIRCKKREQRCGMANIKLTLDKAADCMSESCITTRTSERSRNPGSCRRRSEARP
jgi:hypothetical protein